MNNTTKLLIPSKLSVGFQKREGTYTGKLAYVVHYDSKGVLKKEKSWNSWRDKTIDALNIDNEPTEGFVLNKGVGGARDSWSHWNVRGEFVRVWDPRDFEFEISVANLLFILKECNCSKGKGLEGKFVYSWDKTSLVLLPVESLDYKESINYTNKQTQSISAKQLKVGAVYLTKTMQKWLYLGRHTIYNSNVNSMYDLYNKNEPPRYGKAKKDVLEKRFVFWDLERKRSTSLRSSKFELDFEIKSDIKNLSECIADTHDDYPRIWSKLNNSKFVSPIEKTNYHRFDDSISAKLFDFVGDIERSKTIRYDQFPWYGFEFPIPVKENLFQAWGLETAIQYTPTPNNSHISNIYARSLKRYIHVNNEQMTSTSNGGYWSDPLEVRLFNCGNNIQQSKYVELGSPNENEELLRHTFACTLKNGQIFYPVFNCTHTELLESLDNYKSAPTQNENGDEDEE